MKIRATFFLFLLAALSGVAIRPAVAQSALSAPVLTPSMAHEPVLTGQTPLTKTVRRIVIDAGHGGKDYGALGTLGIYEKDLTLELALLLRDRLRQAGNEVILTRGGDVFVPLPLRSNVANKKGADLFVSIHANASTSASLRGFEVYYLSEDADDAAIARDRAAQSVYPSSTARFSGGNPLIRQIAWEMRGAADRGQSRVGARWIADTVEGRSAIAAKRVRPAHFQVLKNTECPAVLVEVGYISNREDAQRLARDSYKNSIVDAIAEGIASYGRDFEATGGFAR